jgi:hypothetical protein
MDEWVVGRYQTQEGVKQTLFFFLSGFFPRPGYPVEQVAIPAGEGVTEQSLIRV